MDVILQAPQYLKSFRVSLRAPDAEGKGGGELGGQARRGTELAPQSETQRLVEGRA